MQSADDTPAPCSPDASTDDTAKQDNTTTTPNRTAEQLDELLRRAVICDHNIDTWDMLDNNTTAIQLIDEGADPHKLHDTGYNRYPLLYYACNWATADVIQRMLPSKYLNANYELLYMWGYWNREPDGFTLCFEQTGSFLHMAAFYLNASGARALIENGIERSLDHCGRSALHWLSLSRCQAIEKPDEISGRQMPFTMDLAHQEADHAERAVATARVFVEAGFDVNEPDIFGRTPVHYACRYKTIPLLQVFVESGACLSAPDMHGCTPVHYLAHDEGEGGCQVTFNRHRYTPALTAYIKHTLSPQEMNAVDNQGKTPLMYAVETFTPKRVNLFINAGSSLDICDERGWTALHHARSLPWGYKYGCTQTYYNDDVLDGTRAHWEKTSDEMTAMLVAAGADIKTVNSDGQTAQQVFDENMRLLDTEMAETKRKRDESRARLRARDEEMRKNPDWVEPQW